MSDREFRIEPLDLAIVDQLRANGRISNSELAAAVGMPASSCLSRVGRLERAGLITGYRVDLDLAKFENVLLIYCEVTLVDRSAASQLRFEQRMKATSSVIDCSQVTTDCDYIVKIAALSVIHYQELVERAFSSASGVDRYFSYFVLRSFVLDGKRTKLASDIGRSRRGLTSP